MKGETLHIKLLVTPVFLLLFNGYLKAQTDVITGELKTWYPVTITFEGPTVSEAPSTFRDYRLDVTFTKGSKTYLVPGYFAADGNAANSSAASGSKWRVKFTPDEHGTWSYSVSFRTGNNVALGINPAVGSGGSAPDGESGTFEISEGDPEAPGFFGKGMLIYANEHYERFKGSGEWFVKAGPGSPEDFLGYIDFDGTVDGPNGYENHDQYLYDLGGEGLHQYLNHIAQWEEGDPVWQTDKGKGIIGAINYLSDMDVNTLYMIINTSTGDGDNCWPWTGRLNYLEYDVSKLEQWDIVFEHMDKKGVNVDLYLSESENNSDMNGGSLGTELSIYYREIVARFSHHLGWRYNISEEPSMSFSEIAAAAERLKKLDPYGHPVGSHCHNKHIADNGRGHEAMYDYMLGRDYFDGAWMQLHESPNDNHYIHPEIIHWRNESAKAGHKWIVSDDETWGIVPGNTDRAEDYMWKVLMAGGEGLDQYIGYNVFGATDISLEDFSKLNSTLKLMVNARKLFSLPEINMYLPSMSSKDALVLNTAQKNPPFCFAREGDIYITYFENGQNSRLDLSKFIGTFTVQWWDPRDGNSLQLGSDTIIHAGDIVSLGNPPNNSSSSWAAVVIAKDVKYPPLVRITSPSYGSSFQYPAPITITVDAFDSTGIEKVELYLNGVMVDSLFASPYSFVLNNLPEDSYSIEVSAYNTENLMSTDQISINVIDPSAWNTLPWIEDFSSYDNGTRTGSNRTPWTAVRESGIFYVLDDKLAIIDGGAMAYFYTDNIDISKDTVNISLEIEGIVGVDAGGSSNDYFKIYKIVDNAEELIFEHTGDFDKSIVRDPNIITYGNTLSIFIKTETTGAGEYYLFDNLEITRNSYTVHRLETDASNGIINISPAGNSQGVFPDSSELILTAVPDEGWEFIEWDGDLSGSENPETIIMDGDKNITAVFSVLSSAIDQSEDSSQSLLGQNYPNPFAEKTTIPYQLDEAQHVKLTVYNLLGQPVNCLVDGKKEAGSYEIDWCPQVNNEMQPATGIYFYQLEIDDHAVQTKRLILR